MLHAAWVAPGGRLAKRLAARIALLPHSHHHRFPALEQVSLPLLLSLPDIYILSAFPPTADATQIALCVQLLGLE